MSTVRAIIVDDEAPLRDFLKRKLAALWPDLTVCGEAGNGVDAMELVKTLEPDVAFLDIQMPGLSGLDVARHLPASCLPVFITAYDRFAIEAFETGAVDYLLKPVSDSRLDKAVARLKTRVPPPVSALKRIDEILHRLAASPAPIREHLNWIKVRHRDTIRLVSVHEVAYFKATDKYTVVRTEKNEFLIKKTIKELVDQLPPDQFWQIHRATVVNVTKIGTISRSLTGNYVIHLTDLKETLSVSRAFAHLFRQM